MFCVSCYGTTVDFFRGHHSEQCQALLLAVYSGLTSGGLRKTYGSRHQTLVSHVQIPFPLYLLHFGLLLKSLCEKRALLLQQFFPHPNLGLLKKSRLWEVLGTLSNFPQIA